MTNRELELEAEVATDLYIAAQRAGLTVLPQPDAEVERQPNVMWIRHPADRGWLRVSVEHRLRRDGGGRRRPDEEVPA